MKQKLAKIVDDIQQLLPNGKGVVVFELNKNDFMSVQNEFGGIKMDEKQFKVDISGTEVIFILDELLNA